MSKLQTRPRQLGQESPASAPRLLSVVRRTVLGEAARTTRALSVPPGPRDGSDLVATRDGEPVFRARVLFLRALADLGLVPLAERCDAALFAPTAREAWSTFGDKLGEGTPPYEAVLRRREHLAAEVNANDAGAATRSLRASTSPEDFRRDPRSLYITVNALGREALIHDGERWVKVSLDRDVDRHHRYILEGAARERSWRPAPPAPPEARRGLGDLLLHQFTETPRAEERVGVAHLMATYVREHPPMSAWIVDPSRDPDERVRVICIEACARNDLSPLPDLAGRACGASLPERIAYASGLVTRDAPVAVDAWDWLLSDPSDDVRATALLLLSTRRVPDLCRRAIPLLLDPSPDVWTRAASSLRVVFYNDLVRLAAAVRAVAEAAAWTTTETQLALVRVSSDAGVLASLRPLFAHDDASLRRAALETLSHRAAEPLDLAALRPILADRADAVRAAAWRYVAHAGLPVSSLAAETAAALADEGEVRAALPLALVRGTALDQPWQREALLRCVADPVARKALGALAEALSQLAFERVAADW